MITEVWYSVENCGDGSAYPCWYDSEELTQIEQDFMDEGWGETCNGSIKIESEGAIKILDKVKTAKDVEDDCLEFLEETYHQEYEYKNMRKKLVLVRKLIPKESD